jgi:hypothetical protein
MRTPRLIYLKKSVISYGNEFLGAHLLKEIIIPASTPNIYLLGHLSWVTCPGSPLLGHLSWVTSPGELQEYLVAERLGILPAIGRPGEL